MKLLNLLFFGILFFSFTTFSQSDIEKYSDKYPDENGVFLGLNRNVVISIDKRGEPVINSRHQEEILYLNDNYRYYTEESISFTSFSSIDNLTPYVYIPIENGKYKKVLIKNITEEDSQDGGVFHDDIKKKSFFYSGLEKGGKTSMSYEKEYLEPHFFGTFYFESYLPIEKVVFSIETPIDMELGIKLFGNNADKIKYSVEEKGKIKIHTWIATELESFNSEPRSMDISYSATHLQVYIKSYKFKKEDKYILRDVDDLYAYYRGFVNDVNQEGNEELIAIADSITNGIDSNDDKVKAIYYWVQDNIKYVAFEDGLGGFVPREASLVCDRKYGDCKDMSSVLYVMINSIGLPAYYTWIGTRDVPYDYDEVPTPAVDNHMICTYFNGKEYVFIDGTGSGMRYGMPTSFIQGKEALIGMDEDSYKLMRVPEIEMQRNGTIDSVYINIEGDIVKGKGVVSYTGYAAIYLTKYLNNLSNDNRADFYKGAFNKGNNKCESDVLSILGEDNRDNGLIIEYEFKIEDYLRRNEDELYLNPFLKKYYSGGKIKLESFKRDRENTYKEFNNNITIINVPEGYELDYLPENTSFSHGDFSFEINYSFDEVKSQVKLVVSFNFDYLVLKNEDFPEWNKMIKKLNTAYTELIIFKEK